jgi:hypothetical protein
MNVGLTRAVLTATCLALAGAALTIGMWFPRPAVAQVPAKKLQLATPVISCASSTGNTIELTVCAGATGAPTGFSVQWVTCAELALGPDGQPGTSDDGTWYASNDPRLCKASFSGNANNSNWNLDPNQCIDIVIGGLNDADPGVSFNCNDPLDCETCYVFRVFAHATKTRQRSDFTPNLECTTDACEPTGFEDGDHCTRSQGYFSSGNDSRAAEIACFGGDPNGASCTSTSGTPIVTIGGGTYTYTWTTTGTCVDVQPGPGVFLMDSGLANLRTAMGGGGTSGFFTANGSNATSMGTGGGLASQTAALTLNLAIAGYGQCAASGCTDGSAGSYGDAVLCNWAEGDTFKNDGTPISAATAAALNGQTVSDVLAAANAFLGGNGAVPLPYALSSAAELNELVAALNLAFDLRDWDGDGLDNCACGGMTAFAESHLCQP